MKPVKREASPAWKVNGEPNLYRVNELYNRYRQIILEMSGHVVSDPPETKNGRDLENEIVHDFAKLKRKYMKR